MSGEKPGNARLFVFPHDRSCAFLRRRVAIAATKGKGVQFQVGYSPRGDPLTKHHFNSGAPKPGQFVTLPSSAISKLYRNYQLRLDHDGAKLAGVGLDLRLPHHGRLAAVKCCALSGDARAFRRCAQEVGF